MLLLVIRISWYCLLEMKLCKLIKKRRFKHIEIMQISNIWPVDGKLHSLNELSYQLKRCNETLACK